MMCSHLAIRQAGRAGEGRPEEGGGGSGLSWCECGSSFNQCGISSSWGHRSTCVFLLVFQGTLDGSCPFGGNLVKAHLHPLASKDVHRALADNLKQNQGEIS